MNLIAHLFRQREFSEKTFGPGQRTAGVIEHIRKELREVEKDPSDVEEWIDVVILAFDGAMRAGHQPRAVVEALVAKQTKNEGRTWPDWRTVPEGKAIEHVRHDDVTEPAGLPVQTPEEEAHEGARAWKPGDSGYPGRCMVRSIGRYLCTRSPNHSGDHIASALGDVAARWPQTPGFDANGSEVEA